MILITVGGGGIPVVADGAGDLHGAEAVIDKDLGVSLLARQLGADMFLITTAVEKVALNFGTPEERPLDHLTLSEAKAYLAEGTHFAKGTPETARAGDTSTLRMRAEASGERSVAP